MPKFNKISLLYCVKMIKNIVLFECNAINQVSVEWSHPWILSTDSKLSTLYHSPVVVSVKYYAILINFVR